MRLTDCQIQEGKLTINSEMGFDDDYDNCNRFLFTLSCKLLLGKCLYFSTPFLCHQSDGNWFKHLKQWQYEFQYIYFLFLRRYIRAHTHTPNTYQTQTKHTRTRTDTHIHPRKHVHAHTPLSLSRTQIPIVMLWHMPGHTIYLFIINIRYRGHMTIWKFTAYPRSHFSFQNRLPKHIYPYNYERVSNFKHFTGFSNRGRPCFANARQNEGKLLTKQSGY